MKIIIGLGNPGFKYRNTKHNIGFKVIDGLAKKSGIKIKKSGYSGIYGVGKIEGKEVMLFKPLTYMNLSGEAVKSLTSSFAEKEDEILVVADDFDIALGSLRIKGKGSGGTHNGLRSIVSHVGESFARLRVGISVEDESEIKHDFVLSGFPRKYNEALQQAIEQAISCTQVWISEGLVKAMNEFN
ncbi:MAG: aminoacyl-tRNA hydrolase [Candidatus Omnitrophica bacterium]|nr:aminoacyl-tRNA hydrolase [Candidatus Omnitrophota bacterium]